MGRTKDIINLANLKVMFIWLGFFAEIEFTANAKS